MAAEQENREFQARENREQRELAGYGALYEAGRQGQYAGMTEALGGLQSIGGMLSGLDLTRRKNVDPMTSTGSLGIGQLGNFTSTGTPVTSVMPPQPTLKLK